METELSGSSVSDDGTKPQEQISKYLETICPYYIMYGMSWDEFWNESLDRLAAYWQAHQFAVESRNQELWMQGLYIRDAVACCLSAKAKYPEKPHRITAMTDAEREEENKRWVEQLREQLMDIKRRSDARKSRSERN